MIPADYTQSQTMTLTSYLKTNQALWYRATVATSIMTLVTVFLIQEGFYPWNFIRITLGIIFILWLPGYTFIKALFPTHSPTKEPSENLCTVEQIGLGIIISLALDAVIGFFLNFSPWGIRLIPIVLSVLAWVLVSATAAILRDYSIAKNNANRIPI
jgi:uncharacterized membrane protein